MAGQTKGSTRSCLTTIVVALGLLVIYLFLQGNQGEAVHVSSRGTVVYAGLNEFGQVMSYEIRRSRPLIPVPVVQPSSQLKKILVQLQPLEKSQLLTAKPYDEIRLSLGDVSKVIPHDNKLYLIDPIKGLFIYNLIEGHAFGDPVEVSFYGIRDIAFFEKLVFVAAGENGVYVLDLSEPASPLVLSHFETLGTAEGVTPIHVQTTQLVVDPQSGSDQVQEQVIDHFILYVANGEAGLTILDFRSRTLEVRDFIHIQTINTPGYVYDVFFKDMYLFAAVGEAGIQIYDAFSGGREPERPNYLGSLDTPGEAQQVEFYRKHLFAADGESGLYIAQFDTSGNEPQVRTYEFQTVSSNVDSFALNNDLAVLARGVRGIQFVDISNPAQPVLKNSIGTPGLSTFFEIVAASLNPALRSEKIWASVLDMIREFAFAGIGLLVWLLILSPFAQPYNIVRDFWQSSYDFILYLFGSLGRTVFVENGQVMDNPVFHDLSTNRPIILDNSSAGLIRDANGNFRVVGPGTDMLQPDEALVKVADLRPRVYVYGPADEDPFLPQQASEDEVMFNQRRSRRLQTSARTRDGVEIVANLIVSFRVKGERNKDTAPYGYQPSYALQAMKQDFAVNKSSVHSSIDSDLVRLPTDLAVQSWREILAYFRLEDLFSPLGEQDDLLDSDTEFGLQYVSRFINESLIQQYTDEIGDDGVPTGGKVISDAFNELEHAGIEVIQVQVVNLRIDPEEENAFLDHWIHHLPENIYQTQMALQARYHELEDVNRQLALMGFIQASYERLVEGMRYYQTLPGDFLNMIRSLHLLVTGTNDLEGLNDMERLKLDQMTAWLERHLE